MEVRRRRRRGRRAHGNGDRGPVSRARRAAEEGEDDRGRRRVRRRGVRRLHRARGRERRGEAVVAAPERVPRVHGPGRGAAVGRRGERPRLVLPRHRRPARRGATAAHQKLQPEARARVVLPPPRRERRGEDDAAEDSRREAHGPEGESLDPRQGGVLRHRTHDERPTVVHRRRLAARRRLRRGTASPSRAISPRRRCSTPSRAWTRRGGRKSSRCWTSIRRGGCIKCRTASGVASSWRTGS